MLKNKLFYKNLMFFAILGCVQKMGLVLICDYDILPTVLSLANLEHIKNATNIHYFFISST